MDRFSVRLSRPLRIAALLLITSTAIGCQGDPAAPSDDGSDQAARAAERAALVTLYNSTDGDNWINNTGWLLSVDHCSWFGVGCVRGDRVTGVGLSQNNLTGSIPAELGTLTLLDGLGLAGNNLTGSIPAELGNLTLLVILALDRNNLTGPIPAELGNLTLLAFLLLFSNELSGAVPLPVANLGDQIDGCNLTSNPGLFMPDSQDYMNADLDDDGLICGIGLSSPPSD